MSDRALLLAVALTNRHGVKSFEGDAAAELRRLHEENKELRHATGVANQTIAAVVAQRNELLEALKLASQWVEEYVSQMSAYTISEQADDDLSVIRAAINKAEGA